MIGMEKFLLEKFREMPLSVRVITYLVILVVFVYLLLLPRFINGQLVITDSGTGGFVPYRGAELQIQVDGRDYKYRANESGFWSIPVVSRLPEGLEVQVFHEDRAQWFVVQFSATHVWKRAATRIEISNSRPYVRLAQEKESIAAIALGGLADLFADLVPDARAALILPPGTESALPAAEMRRIEQEVLSTVAGVVSRNVGSVGMDSPLSGAKGPSYAERVQIVGRIEKQFGFSIPDEHWRSMSRVRDLVDYVQKRQTLVRSNPELQRNPQDSWPAIQRNFPQDRRPVFRP